MAQIGWIHEDEGNDAAVVIVDEASGDTIEIQRSLAFDEQDVALGMDTYCLVRGGAAHYGGLARYVVSDGSLELYLSTTAAADLELPEVVEIPIDPHGAELLRLRLPFLLA